MAALKLAGCSVRQIAEMTGFSREWVRRRLKSRGMLAGDRAPTGRVRPNADGSVPWGFSIFVVGDEECAWSTTILGIPALRGVLLELGIFSQDVSKAVRESSPSFTTEDGRPSIAKLMSPEGWIIRPEECAAALAVWAESPPEPPLAARMEGVLRLGGWLAEPPEVATRSHEFVTFLAVLRRGADADGLLVL